MNSVSAIALKSNGSLLATNVSAGCWRWRSIAPRRALAALALLLCESLQAASPIGLPSAEWIWASGAPRLASVQLTRNFTAPAGVQSAVVLGACEGQATIALNGARIGEITGRERGFSFEVLRHIRAGENTITLDATGETTNAAVAAILELVLDTGKHLWIVTDGSWRATAPGAPEAQPVARLGRVDAPGQVNPFDPTRAVDAYNSWTLAKGAPRATDPADIRVPPGFTVELLRSAQHGEDSWVAMAFDPQGRITVAREKTPGLLRLTLLASAAPSGSASFPLEGERIKVRGASDDAIMRVELINTNLVECRGLLYAHGALYAHANNSKMLVRLRDTDGDDQFDEQKELLRTEGGVGHGRNHLRLGPDGMIYLIVGDDVAMPPTPAPSSPFKRHSDLPWLPGAQEPQTFGPGGRVLAGYLARFDPEGTRFEVIAGGMRNPLDVAFNADGEAFTYDADNERDIGNPYYKPSRVHHLVSGGDYAWRRGPVVLPSYYPDVLPTMHDVGLGSPTGVEFGTGAKFPEKFQSALYIADWAYGRIVALHLEPHGASYTATREDFATGRPLNVTDMVIGPDGAMYFTTGGRQTQSGLYRVRYTGTTSTARPPEDGTPNAERALRRQLEALHGRDKSADAAQVLITVWPQLGNRDRWISHAARVVLETVDAKHWQAKAIAEKDTDRSLTALLALARTTTEDKAIVERLNRLSLSRLTEAQQLDALRVYELTLRRLAASNPAITKAATAKLDVLYPLSSRWVNRELCKLLVNLQSPTVIAKTTPLIAKADTQEDIVHFLFFLRHAPGPWTLEQRRVFFAAVQKAGQGQGAQNYQKTLRDIKAAAATTLTGSERTALAPLLEDKSIAFAALATSTPPPRFVRDWYFEELESVVDRAASGRSFERGKAAFATAQCALCHRVGTGTDAGGVIGPDLTAVASRFSRRDILDATINPSKAMDDKFRSTVFELKDSESVSGTVESEDAERVVLRPNPLAEETITVRVKDVASRRLSEISPMPTGLLNVLERDQILDLIAFLESGGSAAHAAFKNSGTPAKR
jgi:putative heme-binding domain-containing protein